MQTLNLITNNSRTVGGPLLPEGPPVTRRSSHPIVTPLDPARGADSAPPDPVAGGEGADRPLPTNPSPALGTLDLGLRPFGPRTL